MVAVGTLTFKDFSGINNQADTSRLEAGDLASAINMDVDDARQLRARAGHVLLTADNAHSLFGMGQVLYYRNDSTLKRFDIAASSAAVIDTGLTGDTAYASLLDNLFYTDGQRARTFSMAQGAQDWGIVPPPRPQVQEAAGNLPPGDYLVSATYLGGDESGAPTPVQISITAGGIAVTVPSSVQTGVTGKAIYLSTTGGEVLYRAAAVPNHGAAVVVGSPAAGAVLETLHKTPPPPGQLLALWNGKAIVGTGAFLLYSEPFRYTLFDPLRQNIAFESAVTMFAALGTAAFVVGTETAVYRFDGDISTAAMTKIAAHGAIRGAVAVVDAALMRDGVQGLMAVFASPAGICAVGASGDVMNMTAKRYAPAKPATSGSAVYVPERGNHRVLFTLEP